MSWKYINFLAVKALGQCGQTQKKMIMLPQILLLH